MTLLHGVSKLVLCLYCLILYLNSLNVLRTAVWRYNEREKLQWGHNMACWIHHYGKTCFLHTSYFYGLYPSRGLGYSRTYMPLYEFLQLGRLNLRGRNHAKKIIAPWINMRIITLDVDNRSHSRSVVAADAHFKCDRLVSKASRKQKY